MSIEEQPTHIDLVAQIVAAFVSHNAVRPSEVPELITSVHAALSGVAAPKAVEEPAPELKPAVPVKKSVTDEFIISLEDGRKFKSMKRYLSGLGMTPDDYRAKWGLPRDYPMVAPGYAAKRSELAKAAGLGSGRRATPPDTAATPSNENEAASPAAPAEPVAEPARRRGRPRKDAA